MVDVFRQEGEIWFSSPDGVDGVLPLAPALVLFGPNDAGKSNTLRAIVGVLRGAPLPPREPFETVWEQTKWNQLRLPLDLRRKEHRDLLLAVAKLGISGRLHFVEPKFIVERNRRAPDGELAIADVFGLSEDVDLDDAEGDSGEGAEPARDEGEKLVDSLREALEELVSEAASETATDVVDALVRGAVLHVLGERSLLRLDQTLPPTSDAARDMPERDVEARFVPFKTTLADLIEVVTEEDLERSIGDSAALAERVLKVVTGWERRPPWVDDTGMIVEWQREGDDGLGTDWQEEDPWLDIASGLPSEELVDGCRRLSEEATRLAPAFVTRQYRIEIRALEPYWWDLNGGARLRIALVPHGEETREGQRPRGFGLQAVGAGLRIWATFAVHEALRRLADDRDRTTVFVFDEPERHLHPAAQREAAKFIANIVGDGASVIVATHAPAFLNERIPDSKLVRLERAEGASRAVPLEPGLLTTVEKHAGKLGLTRADLIQLTRSALLVEGPHDRLVVAEFFGRDLADAGIRILVLRGADNALALPDAELLHSLGIRLFLMLDNTSALHADLLNSGKLPTGQQRGPTKEERIHAAVAGSAKFKGLPVTHVPLGLLDIVWAIPEEAIIADVKDFPGWDEATVEVRRRRGDIKRILDELYGLKVGAQELRKWIENTRALGLEQAPQLTDAITRVIATTVAPSDGQTR